MPAAAAVQVSYLLVSGNDASNIAKNKFVVFLTIATIENMIIVSIITSRLSSKSLLIST